jgi:aerobic carbon-monoxide dehydrogenase small subunit
MREPDIMKQRLILDINGEMRELFVEPKKTLLEVLREDLGLTGTKEVCDLGSCGACTVLIDHKPALSCLTLAVACKGKEIMTIEGLKNEDKLHPLQEAFIQKGAIQCGMCTPGFILSAKALLEENPRPTETEVREAISGNLCRCTGYAKIVEAIITASRWSEKGMSGMIKDAPKTGILVAPEAGE